MSVNPGAVTNQADSPNNVPGYAIAPNAVIRDGRLSPVARLLYVILDGRRAVKSRGIRVNVATLAADLGCSESSVRRAAVDLEAAGWLARRRTGRSSSWLLTNPVRTGRRVAALERTLDSGTDQATDRHGLSGSDLQVGSVGSVEPIPNGHLCADSLTVSGVGTLADANLVPTSSRFPGSVSSASRVFIGDASECSPVNALQSITKEDYNSTADSAPAPASGGALGRASQQSERSNPTGQEKPAPTAVPSGQPVTAERTARAKTAGAGGDGRTARAKTAGAYGDPLTDEYLTAINAATGAQLVSTRPLRHLVQEIAARGIPAAEAAVIAAAWLAVKNGRVSSPEGFLAAIALPSLAKGEQLEQSPPKATPVPPAYRDMATRATCDHGAELGRCALCRQPVREESSPPPSRAAEERQQEAAVREAWPAVLDALKASSRVGWMVFCDAQPVGLRAGRLAVAIPHESKARNARASGHEERLGQAIKEATGLDLQVDTSVSMAAASGAPF